MTGLATTLTSALVAGVIAAGSLLGGGTGGTHTAVVVDAALARDGRDLVAPHLRRLDAELRIPRTEAEAEMDLRYLAKQGYRVVAIGPESRAAAVAAGVQTVKTP
jgi:hypothetical protein